MIAWKGARPVVRMVQPRVLPAGIALLMVATAVLFTPCVARAQGAASAQPQGSRWWIGGGGGYLAGRADCTNCESNTPYGNDGAFLVQGGLPVTQRLLVGAEVFSSGRTVDGIEHRNTYVLALAQYRPFRARGFFLKGGYGIAFVKDSFVVEGVPGSARTSGMGLMYGAGWVFGEGHRVSVAPVAAQYVTTVGDIEVPSGTAQNVVVNGWFVGAVLMVR